MAGKVQHEVPRLFQRGFLIPDTGDAERIFVFRRSHSFPSNIDRSGAETSFYSKPTDDGTRTLDDEVTDYESRLGSLVHELRDARDGSFVDAQVAGEVIAHLTTRNAHLRGAFVHGVRALARGALDVFTNEEDLRRMVGIDTPWVSDTFRERVVGEFLKAPQAAALNLPPALLEQWLFAMVREDFSPLFQRQLPSINALFDFMIGQADDSIRDAHNKALAESVVPEARAEDLASFVWRKVKSASDLILPDCVAIAIEADGSIHPLMMADMDSVEAVLLPLTTNTLLVASRRADYDFDPGRFDKAAACCSHSYFLAASQTPEMQRLSTLIGTRSVAVVDAAIEESLSHLRSKVSDAPSIEPAAEPKTRPTFNIPVSYFGEFDQQLVNGINERLGALLGELAWTIPLDRLDGITFADNYPAALAALDRGKLGISPPQTRQDSVAVGVGQSPNVLRDDVLKCHVVVVGYVAKCLVADDVKLQTWAIALLADLISHAGVLLVVDEALPGVLLNYQCKGMEGQLQRCTYPGWNAYFTGRAAAGFDDKRLSDAQDIFKIALMDAFTEIPKARSEFGAEGNVQAILGVAWPKLAFLLEHAGKVAGVADGTDQHPLDGASELKAMLETNGLLAWFSDYRRDLIFLWDRRRRWGSYNEFLALNRHAERLLWRFAIVPWISPDGEDWIELPGLTDQGSFSAIVRTFIPTG